MSDKAGKHIGYGLAWMGFWLMIGLANFGEEPVVNVYDQTKKAVESVVESENKWLRLFPADKPKQEELNNE